MRKRSSELTLLERPCHDEAVAFEEVGGAAGCGAEEDVGETEGFLDASSSVEGNMRLRRGKARWGVVRHEVYQGSGVMMLAIDAGSVGAK